MGLYLWTLPVQEAPQGKAGLLDISLQVGLLNLSTSYLCPLPPWI